MHVHTCVPIYTKERKQLRYSLAKFLKQTDRQTNKNQEREKEVETPRGEVCIAAENPSRYKGFICNLQGQNVVGQHLDKALRKTYTQASLHGNPELSIWRRYPS